MLTDPELKSKVDTIWDRLWSSGLSNPMDSIEQFSYLLFLKRLDDAENQREKQAKRRNQPFEMQINPELRWSHWINFKADEALKHLRDRVFPWLRTAGTEGSSFERYMQNAEFKISKPATLIEVCNLIDEMKISEQNQDVQGDLYEYLLSKLNSAGRNGQFRTPRHIIRMMVQMVDPKPKERIGDLAAGTCGFLVNAYEYILEQHSEPDEKGKPQLIGDLLSDEEREFLQTEAITAYDNDSGMTMLRIGSMNLMLHGIKHPRFFYMDTLSKSFEDQKSLDVVLMNPPFKGKMDESDINPTLPTKCKKTELLFLHLILRVLDMGGRCAVIVPDGVLFGSSNQHQEIRKKLIEENRLDGVVSMPSGVFKPYAGVSTAVLLFTRGGTTDKIWFYDMDHDGFSLDDKRQPVAENDIPDILACWNNRFDADFTTQKAERLSVLKLQIAPLKAERLIMHKEINRLTFENAVAAADDEPTRLALETDKQRLTQLQEQIAPLQAEINQLNRQFWVTKAQVKSNKYDLSASRYRQIEQDEAFYESPEVTMERLLKLEQLMGEEVRQLKELIN
ncbi:HsdM family class I SAM-dependent methyltransferase [Microcoleus vaginatus]|uniref:HsdM family class I SAM-dependent methyltransferase n=1 Tax=Microcoleus vaginatus TaxID=119532 RepID=UPI001685AADA|nr:N-6 DNA methylase [Microcoleus sp. FACHB-84]MBD2009950.1 N-6 DNA methylase [Microcoleus sp. FACHB-45]